MFAMNNTIKLTDQQIECRLNMLEKRIAQADPKDLPYLNRIFQALFDEQVRRDLDKINHE
jgi:hypothetical protein